MSHEHSLAIVLMAAACGNSTHANEPAPPLATPACMDVTAGHNTAQTHAVFAARHCQGGGVTWAGLLHTLVRRRGSTAALEKPMPGWTGDVQVLNGRTMVSIDDEGDAARLCSTDVVLVETIRVDYERLNRDREALLHAMDDSSALKLECTEADGSMPAVPASDPVLPAPDVLADVRAQLARARALIQKQPAWCLPDEGIHGERGVIRFGPTDTVTQLALTGEVVRTGRVVWPREEVGDDRFEVVLEAPPTSRRRGTLYHFHATESDQLASDSEVLVPGDGCLHHEHAAAKP
jgi:hypothetical protein